MRKSLRVFTDVGLLKNRIFLEIQRFVPKFDRQQKPLKAKLMAREGLKENYFRGCKKTQKLSFCFSGKHGGLSINIKFSTDSHILSHLS